MEQQQQSQAQKKEELLLSLDRLLTETPELVVPASCAISQLDPPTCAAYMGMPEDRRRARVLGHVQQAARTTAAAAAPTTMPTAAGVRQTGSLESGEIYVDVLMENNGKQVLAGLLLDTGCNLALNISDYKADQLGLPQNGDRARLEMGQGNVGEVQRRGTVLTAVLLEGEGAEIIKDPHRSSYLEVWTDVGTGGGGSGGGGGGGGASSGGSGSSSSSPPSSGRTSGDDGVAAPILTIKVLSPIHKGIDSRGHEAILGAPGMALLRLGIDCDTMRLYRKQGSSTFRKVGRKVATTPPAPAEQQ